MQPSKDHINFILNKFKNKEYPKALKLSLDITNVFPKYQQGWKILAAIYIEMGNYSQALEANKISIKLVPNDASAYFNYGITLTLSEKLIEAINAYNKAIYLKPNYIEALNNLGILYNKIEEFNKARDIFIKIVSIRPNITTYTNLGNVYKNIKNNEEAIACYKKAISIDKNYYQGYFNLGIIYTSIGKIDDAIINFEKSIFLNPNYAEAHRQLSLLKKYSLNDEHLKYLLKFYNKNGISDFHKCNISFALGKANEDLGDYNKSLFFYHEANSLRKKLLNYHINQDIRLFSQIKNSFSSYKNIKIDDKIKSSPYPIFVLGMPRSGTTLIEQIISSHSMVYGAGEISFIGNHGSSLALNKLESKLDYFVNFKKKYLDRLMNLSSKHKYVVDKMPSNFIYIGLIKVVFPNAKIVHVKRDPAATCWSNYKKYFISKNLGYCYSLTDIVEYYKLYKNLMDFWNDQIKNINIYELDYDHLTNNQEKEIKKLISYLDLEWEEKCLYPHFNRRNIDTASKHQVRKEIYNDSSKDWLNYKPYLNGLLDNIYK